MGRRLRGILRKTESLLFFGKVLRRGLSRDFRHYVVQYRVGGIPPSTCGNRYVVPIGVEDKPNHRVFHWEVHELGEKNKGKIILYLANDLGYGGFCALWIYYLNRLSFAERMGMTMCINTFHSNAYQEREPYRGTRNNVFEYYFLQPGGISVDDALESNAVIYDWNNVDYGFEDFFHAGGDTDYTYKEEEIEQFGRIQYKCLHFQPDVQMRLDEDISGIFSGVGKVVGVHARGTDYKIGYKGHPMAVTAEMYIQKAKELLHHSNAQKVFLATDDNGMIEAFQKAFGDKLLYYEDVKRSEGTVWNCEFDQERPHHRFLLGYEIIRDVMTLGSCDSLVCGMSYVGFMARVVKASKQKKYECLGYIAPGLNKDGLDLTNKDIRAKVRSKWEKNIRKQMRRDVHLNNR